ncbi:MAG: SPOR domain-containing protein [Candidatus Krumholzibacteriaceae bacterium]|jgi:tetratricopeptide (TPR) repeat protein
MNRYFAAITTALAVLAAIAHVAAASGELKRAEELFRRVDYDRARHELAADTAAMDARSLDEAVLMRARLETDFASAEALYARGMQSRNEGIAERSRLDLVSMRYASGDYRGALDLLTGKGAPGSGQEGAEELFFAALCHRQLGDNARAEAEFALVTRGPYASWSALERAGIEAQGGRLPDAITGYEALQKSGPNPVALFKLGECYEALGDRDKALDRYRSLVERFPRSLEAARGNEKIQLLTHEQAKPKGPKPAGGGESGEPRAGEAATTRAARGFTIQFGSFSTRANALAVSGSVEKILRGVRVESVEMDGRVWHRVRAGFYETREAAEKDLARARKQSGLDGTVVPLK